MVMDEEKAAQPISVVPYARKHWHALWELRHYQLAEEGIIIATDEIPDHPMDVGRGDDEWDYHHIAEVYLNGAGGFWLA